MRLSIDVNRSRADTRRNDALLDKLEITRQTNQRTGSTVGHEINRPLQGMSAPSGVMGHSLREAAHAWKPGWIVVAAASVA